MWTEGEDGSKQTISVPVVLGSIRKLALTSNVRGDVVPLGVRLFASLPGTLERQVAGRLAADVTARGAPEKIGEQNATAAAQETRQGMKGGKKSEEGMSASKFFQAKDETATRTYSSVM